MLLVTPLLWLLASAPTGISASPVSWVRWSPDYRRILVMRTAKPASDSGHLVEFGAWKFLGIRDVFPISGVYEIGNQVPLWTMSWFSKTWDLVSSTDLMICARRNRFAAHTTSAPWAVELYHAGSLVRSYGVDDFVTGPRLFLPFTSFDWHSVWYGRFDILPGDRLLVETAPRFIPFYGNLRNPGDSYEIAMSDGTILSRQHPFLRQLQLVVAVLSFVFIVVPTIAMIWWIRRRRAS